MNTFLSGRETVAVEFVKDDKICTMVSSMGLRWGFDTGTQMAVEHFTGRQNLHKEGNNLVCELIFCTIIDLQIGIREQNAIKASK